MKLLHIAAAVCFAIAVAFYIAGGWVTGASVFGALGMVFELAAWIFTGIPGKEK